MIKRLFIIGASVLQLPAIKKAKEMGFYVGVADYNPEAVGIKFADKYFNVSTIDEQGIYRAAKDFRADGIMTLATDMPMRSLAYAAENLNLPGISYETAVKATDKGEMIKAFAANGVEHPWYFVLQQKDDLHNIIEKIKYPCISKPVDNAGSRGVVLVKSKEELFAAFEYSSEQSRNGGVIIEEYLEGQEYSVEIMVLQNIPKVLQVTDKLTTGAPHFVEMGHNQPSLSNDENIEKIKNLACRAVQALGINIGPAHVEIMLTKEGPKMIELGARMGGDCITTHLVPLSTGVDMVKATIELSCGITPNIEPLFNKGSAIRYFPSVKGIIKSISNVEQAKKIREIKEITFVHRAGDMVSDVASSIDRIGFVIAQAETAAEAIKACNEAISIVKIEE